MKIKEFFNKYYIEIIVVVIALIFGYLLTFSTFSANLNNLFINGKLWSDFASHIPLIRSFSLGFNIPPEYPLFPGAVIKYHFLFYLAVGLLEKIGVRIDLALNSLSFAGFFFLILIIYWFSKSIFKSKGTGLLSIIFFLFNSSLSFLYFFKNHPLSGQTISQIILNKEFQSFAPYGNGIITAFWNLNIYTNQRHLALSFGLSLLLIFLLLNNAFGKKKLETKHFIFLGIVLGLSFFLHIAVFLMTVIVIFSLTLLFYKIRKNSIIMLVLAGAIAFPQYLYLNSSPVYGMHLVIGYLTSTNFTITKILDFWFFNLGLSLFLIPLGFIASNKNQKKIFIPFLGLFLIGNLIQFSPEIAANHKFFNYFLLVGNMFSAYFLVKLWNKKTIFKPIVLILFFFMIFGGIIDLFPIINDGKIGLADYKTDERAMWILKNTPPNSVFLNTTYLYDPASMAGRKIFLGWPYFAWSQGYDTDKRGELMKKMLGANDKETACVLLKQNKIDYVEIQIQNPKDPNVPPISMIYQNQFNKIYQLENYSIYDVKNTCI